MTTGAISADHPDITDELAEDSFTLVGMGTDQADLSLSVVPGTPAQGHFDLTNLGDAPLAGITARVVGAPTNVTVNVTV